jgi:CBS domain-containing protein
MPVDALVEDYMTPAPLILREDDSSVALLEMLTKHKVSGAPVVAANGRLAGVVSVTDLIELEVLGPRSRHGSLPEEDSMLSLLDVRFFGEQDVRDLMSRPARITFRDSTIGEAAHEMIRFGIHRLVVVDAKERVVGILSTLDVTRAAADSDVRLPVSRIMSRRPVAWVEPHENGREALRRLQASSVTALLVVADGRPTGFVSQADLVTSMDRLESVRVQDVLSTKLLSCEAETPLNAAARMLMQERVRRLLVTDGGRPAGIVTSTDVTRALDPNSGMLA